MLGFIPFPSGEHNPTLPDSDGRGIPHPLPLDRVEGECGAGRPPPSRLAAPFSSPTEDFLIRRGLGADRRDNLFPYPKDRGKPDTMHRSPEAGRRPVREPHGAGDPDVGAIRKPHLLERGYVGREGDARPALSVVVPAYNEGERLGDSLAVMWTYLRDRHDDFELIVVDDGSLDATAAIVEAFARDHAEVRLVSYRPNRGKGHAVRVGMLEARGG